MTLSHPPFFKSSATILASLILSLSALAEPCQSLTVDGMIDDQRGADSNANSGFEGANKEVPSCKPKCGSKSGEAGPCGEGDAVEGEGEGRKGGGGGGPRSMDGETKDLIGEGGENVEKSGPKRLAERAVAKDPALEKIIESITLSADVKKAAGRNSQVLVVSKSEVKEGVSYEGLETPFPNVVDMWGPVEFQLRQDPKTEQRGGVVAKTAGVYPDRMSGLRKQLAEEVATINSLFYEALVFKKALGVAEMELEALDRQVTYETIRLEAGVGDPEKLASARARAIQAEVDLAVISRNWRKTYNGFLSKTGISVDDVPASDHQWLFSLQPQDIDFASISHHAIMQSQDTKEATAQIQSVSSDILFSGEALLAQKLCTDAAAEALRRTRDRLDEGASSESDLAGVEALLLNSQKRELLALASYVKSRAAAYPNVTLTEFNPKINPVSISVSGVETKNESSVWFLVSGAVLLGAAILLGLYKSPERERRKEESNSDGTSQ